MGEDHRWGPFRNDEEYENRNQERRRLPRPQIDHERNRLEIARYFEARRARLQIVRSTTTPRGQTLDWIPIESQHPRGEIASPPPRPEILVAPATERQRQEDHLGKPELEAAGIERGPKGTVPVMRKKLEALGFTRPLKQYLAKSRGHRILRSSQLVVPAPEEGGSHRYGFSGQSVTCYGGDGQLSCYDPYTESSDDFSLIQIGLSNSQLGFAQTVEAGWQECQDLTGDWVPHLFVYYTTNGYTDEGDNKGGYNQDVDGWVQYDDTIFPGTTFTPYSTRGGEQRKISIRYQLYEGNWWFACQDRWVGYYPASLFFGNQSKSTTLGHRADFIGFWGEIFDSNSVAGRTRSDMGSGYFRSKGWPWSAYLHNLRYQGPPTPDHPVPIVDYDGSDDIYESDPDMYGIDGHFKSGSSWGSYVYVGGPGAG